MSEREQRAIKGKALAYYVHQDRLYLRPKPGMSPRQIPQLEDLPRLLEEYHGNSSTFGHLSTSNTYQLLTFRYYWKGMWDHVTSHVESCTACSSRKRKNHSRYELYQITPPASIFVLLGMDTVAMPPGQHGNCSLITLIDYTID